MSVSQNSVKMISTVVYKNVILYQRGTYAGTLLLIQPRFLNPPINVLLCQIIRVTTENKIQQYRLPLVI